MRLLHLISWPYVRRHVLRTALTVAGIVLGVAVFVAMHTANQSVLSAFSETIDRIAGKTELQITAGETGFSEDILEKVQSSPVVRVAVPVIEAVVESDHPGQGTLLVLAVDMTGDRSLREYDLESGEDSIVDDPLVFLAQPDSLIISQELAERHGLGVGSLLPLQTAVGQKSFTIRGIMKAAGLATAFGGNLAIMDVYAAQFMFGRGRTFDRIDLALRPGTGVDEGQQALAAVLGPGFEIQPPASRGRQAETMLAGYSVMVSISSAFALFIGMFIIYNSFAIAVTQRRSEIGILRALGATRRQIRWLFLGESAVMGIVGSIAGAALGIVLSRASADVMSRLAGDLYGLAQRASDVATNPAVLWTAIGVGVLTSLVAVIVPAWDAARVDPVQTIQKGHQQTVAVERTRSRLLLATCAAIGSAACLLIADQRPIAYAGYAFSVAAALLVAPYLSSLLAAGLRPILERIHPVEGALAADSLIQAPKRTSATVVALMLSVALTVAFAGMAQTSYASVVNWMDDVLNPDLIVMPSSRMDLRNVRFPATMQSELAMIPGIERVQPFRFGRVNFKGMPITVVAMEMTSVAETVTAPPIAGDSPGMYHRAAAGETLIVSDNLSQRFGFSVGDQVELPAPGGMVRLPISGIIVDYTDQNGAVFIDRSIFLKYWNDDSVNDYRVFIEPAAQLGAVRQRIIERYAGERRLFVLSSEEIRSYVLRIAGQWFGVMNVQVAVAMLVAVLGIVNTLTVSITDRRRELGVLRAVGAFRNQIRQTIWLEALAIGTVGVLLGMVLGAINLYYVLDIVQRDVAGLRLPYEYPTQTALILFPLILAAAFAAAIWPAEAAVRMPLVEAVEYE